MIDNSRREPFQELDFSEIVDSVSYIKLQTATWNLLKEIKFLHFTEYDGIIVSDGRIICRFDYNGNAVSKIGNRGRAEGEYITAGAVMWNKDTRRIAVYDNMSRKMLFFTPDGKLVRAIPEFCDGKLIRNIIDTPNGFLCYTYDCSAQTAGNCCGLWSTDDNGNFQHSYFTYDKTYPPYFNFHHSALWRFSDTVFLRDVIHADIYKTEGDSIRRLLDFTFDTDYLTPLEGSQATGDGYTYAITHQMKGPLVLSVWGNPPGENKRFHTVTDIRTGRTTHYGAINYYDTAMPVIMPSPRKFAFVDSNLDDALVVAADDYDLLMYLEDDRADSSIRKRFAALGLTGSEQASNPVLQILHVSTK